MSCNKYFEIGDTVSMHPRGDFDQCFVASLWVCMGASGGSETEGIRQWVATLVAVPIRLSITRLVEHVGRS